MLEGRSVVFISCMASAKRKLAGPIRDALSALGYRAVIVMDEPALRGSFDPESKVDTFLDASDAFVALCTSDPRVPGGTAQNIIDEIARARSRPRLREVVCVLKEKGVQLPSNINPVWTNLITEDPQPAFRVIRGQLESWGVLPTMPDPRPTRVSELPAGYLHLLFDGVELGGHDEAERRIRHLFNTIAKEDQHSVVAGIFGAVMSTEQDSIAIHIAASFLEASARLDHHLIRPEWIEQLVVSPVVQHRMSASIILWDLSIVAPGLVPLDFVAKLAKPAVEDWYVFAPAIAAAKQLCLTRKSALGIILDLARSSNADDRDYAVRALTDLAHVDAAIVPTEAVRRLAKDSDSSVARTAAELFPVLGKVTDSDRRTRYGRFGI